MYFSTHLAGTDHRVIDFTQQARASALFPVSLGFRSQALTLRFVSPRPGGHFIQSDLTLEEVFAQVDRRLSASSPHPSVLQTHIGETLSLIYAPFYLENRLYDAVLNKAVSKTVPPDFEPTSFSEEDERWHIRFIPTLCPKCGWDMKGERDSLVLHCKNCSSTWRPDRERFKQINAAHAPGDAGEHAVYLPFWRIEADMSGLALRSYADLVRVANLPRAVQKGWEDTDFHFWVPAFKIRPRLFLRIIQHITLAQPRKKLLLKMPKADLHPVTMPVSEALESLKMSLVMIAKPKTDIVDRLPEIEITPKSALLVYLPFTQSQHEFIQTDCRLAINKNALAFGKQL